MSDDTLPIFLNRLRILRSLDSYDVPEVSNWGRFRDNPAEYFISCCNDDAERIWTALRKREK